MVYLQGSLPAKGVGDSVGGSIFCPQQVLSKAHEASKDCFSRIGGPKWEHKSDDNPARPFAESISQAITLAGRRMRGSNSAATERR